MAFFKGLFNIFRGFVSFTFVVNGNLRFTFSNLYGLFLGFIGVPFEEAKAVFIIVILDTGVERLPFFVNHVLFLSEIAQMSEFPSESAFYRVFKKKVFRRVFVSRMDVLTQL